MNSCNQNDKIQFLEKIPIFKGLSYEQLTAIASVAFFKNYKEDEIVIKENVPSTYLYIICSGKVKVIKASKTGKTKILGFLTIGDFFGEISLLTTYNPSATVKCKEETQVLILGREDFLNLIKNNFDITRKILEEISTRLYHADIEIVDLSFESITYRCINTLILLGQKTPEVDRNQMIINIPVSYTHLTLPTKRIV